MAIFEAVVTVVPVSKSPSKVFCYAAVCKLKSESINDKTVKKVVALLLLAVYLYWKGVLNMSDSMINHKPYFSIIIPAYNAERLIETAIKSVQRQTFKDWELIIVENGSDDRTTEICESYMKDSRINLIHSEKGVSKARNTGLAYARGEWIVFLDADDTLLKDALQIYKNCADQFDPDLIQAEMYHQGKKYTYKRKLYKTNELDDFLKKCLEYPTQNCNIAAVAYRSEIIAKENIQFEQEIKFAEDSLFVLKYILKCKKILTTDSPVYNVFYDQNSTVRSGKKQLEKEYLPAINSVGNLLNLNDQEMRNYWYIFTLNQLLVIFVNDVFGRPESEKDQKRDAERIMEIPEYKNAIHELDLSYAHGVNRVMFYMMKKRMMAGICIAAHYKRRQNLKKAESQNV